MNEQQYLMLCARRQGSDAFVWQTPPLAIAAQAFLLIASLDDQTKPGIAVVLAVFSGLLGMASVQLMMKHRHREIEDSELLLQFERAHEQDGYAVLHGRRGPVDGVPRNWLVRQSSFRVWSATLAGFVGLALYAAIVALTR
ncbi:MAG: hypothetical protein QOI38_2995 [Sphingomonadales bacterium]|jgi:hypothetical protein|nr:hypothetical protein [Sphingomonadales bacterium]